MGIYTRRGDAGQTGLADGSRASKDSPRVEAYGSIDEAAAVVGWARVAVDDQPLGDVLRFVQQRLFNCSSTLANPTGDGTTVSAADVAFVEAAIDRLSAQAGGWRGFTLASGSEAATRLHLARTVTRRAERRIVTLAAAAPVPAEVLAFVNRVSDLLFAAAGAASVAAGIEPDLWDADARPPAI
jgi:cob(I)alamin adenosyltransferase